LQPYHWFGELPLIDGLPHKHDAVADGATVVLCVPQARLQSWLDSHPVHWRDMARLSAGKLRVAYQVIGEPGSVLQRLARRLWLVAHGFGSRIAEPRQRLNVSQEQLAHMLGTSRQSINMALRSLESSGLIVQRYRGIEVLDIEALRLSATRSV
jgi:CRP-like cAMP-binding protein